ncbi:hypothetical protein EV175_006566, partial [Coemansia sp. RSA 1933]
EDHEENDTIIDKSFIDDAYENYYPLSKPFKYLEVSQNYEYQPFHTAEVTTVLAIFCPNFVSSLTWAEDIPDFDYIRPNDPYSEFDCESESDY